MIVAASKARLIGKRSVSWRIRVGIFGGSLHNSSTPDPKSQELRSGSGAGPKGSTEYDSLPPRDTIT